MMMMMMMMMMMDDDIVQSMFCIDCHSCTLRQLTLCAQDIW